MEPIEPLCMDEVARSKRHRYVTNFLDFQRAKVVFVAPGRGKHTAQVFRERCMEKAGNPDHVKTVVMDMSPSFIAGVQQAFPKATIVFDKFHTVQLLNQALEKICRREQKQHAPLFSKMRFVLLKDPKKLRKSQKQKLEQFLCQGNLDTAKAYSLVQRKRPFWAGKFFGHWVHLCTQSKIPGLLKLAQTIRDHLRSIVAFFRHRFTNAKLEGFHSKLWAITKRSYGHQMFLYLRIMILLAFGKLNLNALSLG